MSNRQPPATVHTSADWYDVMRLVGQQRQEGTESVVLEILRRYRGEPEPQPEPVRPQPVAIPDPLPAVAPRTGPAGPNPADAERCRALLIAVEQLLQQAQQLAPDDNAITDLLQATQSALQA